MSEPGEIPANNNEPTTAADDDEEEGEVVEAVPVVAGHAETSEVVSVQPTATSTVTSEIVTANASGITKEEEKIPPAQDSLMPPPEVESPKGSEDMATMPSEKPQEDEREAVAALLGATPASETTVQDVLAAAESGPVPAPKTMQESEAKREEMSEYPGAADDSLKEKAQPEFKETTAQAPTTEDEKMEEAEDGELEEEGQVDYPVQNQTFEAENNETETKILNEDEKLSHDADVTEKPEDTSMDVGETNPEDESKDTSDEDGEIKEEDDEEEEDGEIHESAVDMGHHREGEGGAKEDETIEDAKSEMDEKNVPDDTPDAYADTASTDGDTASVADEKPSYSTRGRASGTATPILREVQQQQSKSSKDTASMEGSNSDQWERSVREALEDLSRTAKDGAPAGVGTGGTSFLEALGEEERRTRTRFLPAVEGIHQLRKNEIKSDLALARSIMSQGGNVTSVASVAGTTGVMAKKTSKKKKQQDGEPDGMDVDDGDVSLAAEEDVASDVGVRVASASTIEVTSDDILAVPSTAFIPPPAATQSVSSSANNGDKKEDGAPPAPVISTGVKGILNNQGNVKSPRVVESVSAFNPPRPPESIGKKKQHRMLRWERRPADVEIDLNNYRKTVDRTRKELHTAEFELERIENTSNHLRRHFLGHLKCMDQESDLIAEELSEVQQRCVSAADLLTSRTRSRGAGKGSYVMKDVLAILKSRGAELSGKGLSLKTEFLADVAKNFPGVGGVSAASFADWDQDTVVVPQRIASSWILPDDTVQTPYGEGKVLEVFQTSSLDMSEPPLPKTQDKTKASGGSPTKMDVDRPQQEKSLPASGEKKKAPGTSTDKDSSEDFTGILAPRICVRLPFGVGYFSSKVVTSKQFANTLLDAQLVKRWKSIVDTATMVSGQIDQSGMATIDSVVHRDEDTGESFDKTSDEAGSGVSGAAMDIDSNEKAANTGLPNGGLVKKVEDPSKLKLLPYGSGLLPTGTGRGNHMAEMDVHKLQQAIQPALTGGKGVLGDKANEGVPQDIKRFEGQRQASYTLQARVLHLRNQLYRQRRIRALNEKTFTTTKDKSVRVESLVAEMRTDLKSLKNRLDEELKELGIDPKTAEAILKDYYFSRGHEGTEGYGDEDDLGQKRSRDGLENHVEQLAEEERQAKRTKVSAQ